MSQRAKQAIVDSFKDLLQIYSLDKITVKGICEQCGVNRQTFYYYYTDIMDLLKSIIIDDLSEKVEQNRTFDTWNGGFLATMNYLEKNSKMVLNVYHSSYWPEANGYLTRAADKLLDGVVEECAEKLGVRLKEKDQKFIVTFYRRVFTGLMLDWVKEGMEEEPQEVLKNLSRMIRGSIPRSVAEFTRDKN